MRLVRIILGLFLLIVVASDAAAQNVSSDFDPRVNFSQYKTFMWISPPRIVADPLMEPRLIDHHTRQMARV
jgi:hypothetical protein